ncbi:MAG: 2'-5' RNA ligase family protein [Acidobacteria bacterium]|nr:2'-5' RNA ligase family protein [Acidobacteriota bacterium]
MPSSRDTLAVDVAVLLPEPIQQCVRALNAALRLQRKEGFRFDASHLPHVSLVQQFVRRENLSALVQRLDSVLGRKTTPPLRVIEIGRGDTTSHFLLQRTPELLRLHETLMDLAASFEELSGTTDAFFSDDEPARLSDVEWVLQFRSRSSYKNFSPHITLGIGSFPKAPEDLRLPLDFVGERIALCQLGRSCTCRTVIREWGLPPR